MKNYTRLDMKRAFEAGVNHYRYNHTEDGGMFSEILHPKFGTWLDKYDKPKKKQLNIENI